MIIIGWLEERKQLVGTTIPSAAPTVPQAPVPTPVPQPVEEKIEVPESMAFLLENSQDNNNK